MMTDLLLFIVFLALLMLMVYPLGQYMAKVYSGEKTVYDRVFQPIANILYRLGGVDAVQEMNWRQYAGALVIFNVLGMAAVFGIQVFQHILPFNPESMPAVPFDLAFNTADSF